MKSKLEVRGTAVGGGDNSFKAFFVRLMYSSNQSLFTTNVNSVSM